MPIRKFNPTSPGRRFQTGHDFDEITTSEPHKPLVETLHQSGGRNNGGHLTSWWRGGGHKRQYRVIDFKRDKHDIPAKVATIEYDPNRSARIALVTYADGEKRYILAPLGLKVGDAIMSGSGAEVRVGNCLPIRNIPLGTQIHNIEMQVGRGGQLVRSAGESAQLMARDETYAQVRMPSGEVRRIHINCMATIGQVGNLDHENIRLGKAGRNRWLGYRPTVRGSVMNPRDHPHGGGEGRTPRGGQPQTKWGKPAHGRTRNNPRTDNMIVRKRYVK